MGLEIIALKILEISITASAILLVILFLRSIGGKFFSSKLIYCLWLIFILKLCLPFCIPSEISLENITDKYIYNPQFSIINIDNLLDSTVKALVNAQKNVGIYHNNQVLKKPEPIYRQGKLNMDVKLITDKAFIESSRYSNSLNLLLTGLSLLWLIGFIISIVLKIHRNLIFKRFFVNKNYCTDPEIKAIFVQCKKEVGINKNIDLIISGSVIPIIYGIFKPCILLPYDCKNIFSSEELRYILLHELEHYKHKDIVIYLLEDILNTIHWFNPLIHLGIRKMQDDSEVICDLRVLKLLNNKEQLSYGRLLVKQAEINANNFNKNNVSACLLGRKSQLHLRIKKIINFSFYKPRKWHYFFSVFALVLFCFILIPGSTINQERKKYAEKTPNLYAFWLNDDIDLTNMKNMDSIVNQMVGNPTDNKDILLLLSQYEDLSKTSYPFLLEQTGILSLSKSPEPIEIETLNLRREIKKRGLTTGKIYVMLSYNLGYTKYFSMSKGKRTLFDLESIEQLNKVNLY